MKTWTRERTKRLRLFGEYLTMHFNGHSKELVLDAADTIEELAMQIETISVVGSNTVRADRKIECKPSEIVP